MASRAEGDGLEQDCRDAGISALSAVGIYLPPPDGTLLSRRVDSERPALTCRASASRLFSRPRRWRLADRLPRSVNFGKFMRKPGGQPPPHPSHPRGD